jgi:hypothetical protein
MPFQRWSRTLAIVFAFRVHGVNIPCR